MVPLNAAARLVVVAGKYQHITPVLRDVFRWLPVHQWIMFKVAVAAFHCVSGTGPAFFEDVCMPVADIACRAHLRSAERHDTLMPRTKTQLGRRSFHVAPAAVWNALPTHLRSASISRVQFRDGLKTDLFTQALKYYSLTVYNFDFDYDFAYLYTYLSCLLIYIIILLLL